MGTGGNRRPAMCLGTLWARLCGSNDDERARAARGPRYEDSITMQFLSGLML
jgi:hypothetical protein